MTQSERTPPAQARQVTGPYRVLAVITSLDEVAHLLPVAEAIVNDRDGQLVLLLVVTVPEGQPLNEAAAQASRMREGMTQRLSELTSIPVGLRTMVRPHRQIWDGIWETVAQEQIGLLMFDWCCPLLAEGETCRPFSHPQLRNPPCDLAVIRPAEDPAAGGIAGLQRILLPVRGGPGSSLALRIAHALAQRADAEITLLHVETDA
ncbi:MAG TPA: universal stress protein, partial [Anaerolineaceae bacterium]|nr:universal stress protein [Anaerolineaceae bacterium]